MLPVKRLFIYLLLFESFVVTITFITGIIGGDIQQPFEEGELLTGVSFLQFLILSVYSWNIFRLHKIPVNLKVLSYRHSVWLVFAVGFIYLSFDEVFMIHENLDFFIHRLLDIEPTNITDRLDDIIVLTYGLTGLAIVFRHRDELKNYADSLPYLKYSYVLFFSMVFFDLLTNSHDVLYYILPGKAMADTFYKWSYAAEESFKVFAEAGMIAVLHNSFQIALTDSLMDIDNRAALYTSLKKTHSTACRYQSSYGIIICDINDFALYNNNYSNLKTKNLLMAFADNIKSCVRLSDSIFRWGSKGIAIILQNQDIDKTAFTAEKLKEIIASQKIEHKGSDKGIVTLSCGIAAYNNDNEKRWRAVLDRAEKVLADNRSS